MYNTRKFVKGLLIPSFGVGVVHAKGEQNKDDCDDSKKLIRARELPLYVEPPKCVACSNKVEDEDGFLITTIRCARQELQQIVGQARMIQSEVRSIAETVVKETEDAVSYLRQEENLLPRLGAIGLGSFAGYLLACRKGIIRKTLYSAAGAGLVAAVAYPTQAREYTEEVACEMKKYAVIGYHFLNGADVDWKKLDKIKPPCFTQSIGSPVIQGDKMGRESARAINEETPLDGKALGNSDACYDEKSAPEKRDKLDKPSDTKPDKLDKPSDTKPDKLDKPSDTKPERTLSEKSEPVEKRSYIERCRERGACGTVKKKPIGDGNKCDPSCSGNKRGSRLKQSDSEAKSKSSIDKKKCLSDGVQSQQEVRGSSQRAGGAPEQSKPKEPEHQNQPETRDPCPRGQESMPERQESDSSSRELDVQPQLPTRDPCKKANGNKPQQPSDRDSRGLDVQPSRDPCKKPDGNEPYQPTRDPGSDVLEVQPQLPTRDPCEKANGNQPDQPKMDQKTPDGKSQEPTRVPCKRAIKNQPQTTDPVMRNAFTSNSSQANKKFEQQSAKLNGEKNVGNSSGTQEPKSRGKAGGPILGGVTNNNQGSNGGLKQNMIPCPRNEQLSVDTIAARDAETCKNTMKKSSITVSYPKPPCQESFVVVNPNEETPCNQTPRGVNSRSRQRKATLLAETENPYLQPRQTRVRTRQRRETEPVTGNP